MGLLSLITFLPLLGSFLILFVTKENRQFIRGLAVLFSGMSFVLSVIVYFQFNTSFGGIQFMESALWISSFNIHYTIGVDGLSLPMVLLTTLLSLIAVVASFGITNRIKEYFFWFLLLETGMLGVFVALDFFLFYVFWEVTLVPMYFLIGVWGGPKKEYAALKFFLYTLFGSVFMLVGILALYFASDPRTFNILELGQQSAAFAKGLQIWIFLALYVGFAVKIPAFPFHTWLPLAHVEAPTAVSVVLAGVLLKMGVYGLLRISFTVLPAATQWFLMPLVIIAFINIIYGALCAMAQKDMKRMVAYSSINHMGYCMLGMAAVVGTNAAAGLSGAVLQMVTHGIITGSLFLLVGVLYDQAHTRDIDQFGGLGARLPIFTGFMVIQIMASMGLPGLAGFVSEFLCFLGAFGESSFRLWVALSLFGIVLTAGFFLKLLKDVFWGPFNSQWEGKLRDMSSREILMTVPLVALTILIGVYPNVALKLMDATLTGMIEKFIGGS